jgi:hypothetical protein
VLGEHALASGKDCLKSYCAPAIQEIDVDEVIVHEKYNPKIPQVSFHQRSMRTFFIRMRRGSFL